MTIKVTRDLLSAVREMLDRHWNLGDIAAKLNLDPTDVQTLIDVINNILT